RDAEIIAGSADRVEHRLARRQEPIPIRPSVIVRSAISVLFGQLQRIRGVVGGACTALVRAVLADEQASSQGMIVWREANGVAVPIAPREGLNAVFGMCHI